MKVAASRDKAALTSGGLDIVNVGISDDPEDQLMILNVLSNSLYTDKVAAVLREYGCNAADANVEAGRKQPIEVRLPNKLDPTVAIRDFGDGMTPEQIMNTFIKLGRSTKRNSNAFTGMLGIGSKAGFAYGDSFVVTSYTKGHMAVYSLFREKGAPKMAPLHSGPTDQPDGVEVKVPVRVEDMQEFIDKAKQVYSYFKVRPIIHGAKIEWIPRDKLYEGVAWRYTGNRRSVAIMGNVAYKLDSVAMGFKSYNQYAAYQSQGKEEVLIAMGVELDFRIGDLEIAANREGLQYSDLTKNALRAALAKVVAEIGTTFTKSVAACKSLWEAHQWYTKQFGELQHYERSTLKSLLNGQITWQGHKINSSQFFIGNKENDAAVGVAVFKRGGRRYNSAPGAFRMLPQTDEISAQQDVKFVINDMPKGTHSPSRIKALFLNDVNCSYIVQFRFDTDAAKTKFWKARGLDGITTVSLKAVTPALATPGAGGGGGPSAHANKHAAKVFTFNETKNLGYGSTRSLWWDSATADLPSGSGVYVKLDSFFPELGGATTPTGLFEIVAILRKAELLAKGEKIYGFKADKIAKLGPKWETLEDHIKVKLDAILKNPQFNQELADINAAAAYSPMIPVSERKMVAAGSMRKLLDEYARMRTPSLCKPEIRDVLMLSNRGPWKGMPAGLPKASFDLKAQEKIAYTDYPMLPIVKAANPYSSALSGTDIKIIVDYIKLVESN